MFNKTVFLVLALSLTMAGCTTFKKVTGQTNDTVLPGQREDILPPDQQTARDPAITNGQPSPGGAIQQDTITQPGMAPAQPGMPQTAQKGDLLPGHQGTVVTCDPLVETCPGMVPATPQKVATKAKAGKVITAPPKAGATVAAKTDTSVETVGADPMKPEATPIKKKKKKKLLLKPKDTAATAPDITMPGAAAQAPPPIVPPDAPAQ
ncbi:MAG: hypothetical protein ABIN69_13270 [Aestuariivirga sp.]